ncbi:MAG: LytR C-terminal domain-containing protein [Bacteroidetes bacterium]|nr:LytR C-terminal domain-containing protein [Bacteroidota bacterium]
MTRVSKNKQLHPKNLFLNIVIALLAVVVFFLLYSFITNSLTDKPVDWTTETPDAGEVVADIIQLDVLNGCGVSGVAQRFTDYLRKRNFDVVQSANYKTFDVEHSLVIDRTGDLATARKVAYALGIEEKNIVQQINPDYYLNVSVVIGRDYESLKPSH